MTKEDYFKYYIQGSEHYLIPKGVFDELYDEMVNWREEIKELNKKYLNAVADYETTMSELQEIKKQIEEKNKPQIFIDTQDIEERYAEGLYQDYLEEENKKYKNQQKEFINYLEDEIKIYSNTYMGEMLKELKEILQKYKEIIGGKNE